MNKAQNRRVRILREGDSPPGPVVYWMSRDQRANDNWALLFAQNMALERRSPLCVVFCLVPEFLGATIRHYGFMIRGLQELEKSLGEKNISFHLLQGKPEDQIPLFIAKHVISILVTDFDPLRIKRVWKEEVSGRIEIPFYEVDAHNTIPCWIASAKEEFAARTFRLKVSRILPEFLEEFPRLKRYPYSWRLRTKKISWESLLKNMSIDRTVPEVGWIQPGEKAAKRMLQAFIMKKIHSYPSKRNDPAVDGQSDLSPYLHFGQISAQRIALEVLKSGAVHASREAFLEELIVRRELSDNFCSYNEHYDSFQGFPDWARRTLDAHRKDKRQFLYTVQQFEHAKTHDPLWNAAQREMVSSGKMHGYMRMYWAKKILEWTKTPEEAVKIAIYLNDRYELDGRDPNGYTGIVWSIGGVHDRAWNERPVFGKIRFMSYNGCRSKFDVEDYIEKIQALGDLSILSREKMPVDRVKSGM